jgi:Tfp pilus assembly protein PilN
VQLGIAVAGLVLLAGLGSMFLMTNAQVADKERRYHELRGELAAKNVTAQEPVPDASGDATLIQERDARRGALATALGSRIAWDRLLRDLSLVLPEDVWFTSLSAKAPLSGSTADVPGPNDPSVAPTGFTITGKTYSHEGVARLLSRLSVLPDLTDVELQRSTLTTTPGQPPQVDFTIVANVRPAGATS